MRRYLPLALALIASPCTAQDGKNISPLDLLVDFRSLAGQKVTSGPCLVSNASTLFVHCAVHQNGRHVGAMMLRPQTMDRESLRRALRDCNGFQPPVQKCAAYVTGVISDNGMGQAAVDGASLRFRD